MSGPECSDLAEPRKGRRGQGRLRVGVLLVSLLTPWLMAPTARAQVPVPITTSPAPPATPSTSLTSPLSAPLGGELLARAASPDPAQRLAAVATLQASGSLAAWNLILIMMQRDLDPRVRYAAALALGASRNPDFAGWLQFASVADPDPSVRAVAALAHRAVAPFAKRPKLAAGLSVLCPGCGYFYLGQTARALSFLGATAALVGAGLLVQLDTPVDPSTGQRGDGRAQPLLNAAQDLWFYGVYATYRDARLARGDAGHQYPVAREHRGELAVAPFNPQVLKRPWVWAGVPLMLGAALGFSYLVSGGDQQQMGTAMRALGDPGGVRFFGHRFGTGSGFALGEVYNLGLYTPVGVGEEALFRGVLQAGLSETPLGLWGGWAVGSAIFGAVHVFNFIGADDGVRTAAVAVPYLMVTGSYLGLIYIKTDFSLLAGVAAHFWYDFLLGTLDFIADPDHQPFVMRVGMPW